jgi:iron-sulfur cluster repair protein YtfE (RIC family)
MFSTDPTTRLLSEGAQMASVVELIERDHREVEQLFSEFKNSRDAAVAEQICDELTKHTYAEDQAVYPIIAEKVDDGAKLAREADNEHKEARQMIGRIRNTTDETHLAELMQELEQAIQHHVSEEEDEMLPKAQQAVDSDELDEMGRAFEAAKDAAGRQSG